MALQRIIQKYGRRKEVLVLVGLLIGTIVLAMPMIPASVLNSQVVLITKPSVSTVDIGSAIEFEVSFLPSSLGINDPIATDLQLMVTSPSGGETILDEALDFYTPESFTRKVTFTPTMNGTHVFRAGMIVVSETQVSDDPPDDPPEDDGNGEETTTYIPSGGGGGYYAVSVVSILNLVEGTGESEYYNTREVTVVGDDSGSSGLPGVGNVSFPNFLFIITSIGLIVIMSRRKKNNAKD